MEVHNNFISVPEYTIEKILNQIVKFIRKDYATQMAEYNDEKLTWLYLLTHNIGYQRLNMFSEAKKIFLTDPTDEEDGKRIRIYLSFPQKIESGVAVCISHSGEQHGQNVLSVSEDHDEQEYVYEDEPEEDEEREANAWRKSYSRRYSTTYNIIITGDNTNETLITYLIFKAALVSLEGTSHLDVFGFTNLKISSKDMQIKSEISKIMFAKTLDLNFEYEFRVPDVTRQKFMNAAIFKGIMKDEII